MSVHRVWELAKESFKIQGGTIHQVAKDYLKLEGNGYLLDLFMDNGTDCMVNVKGLDGKPQWVQATFLEYTGIHKYKDGNAWLAASAFIPGFSSGGTLTGLKVGSNIVKYASSLKGT